VPAMSASMSPSDRAAARARGAMSSLRPISRAR
jgi:hypothetical protein